MHVTNVLLATYAFAEVGHALKLPFGFHLPWASAHLNNNQIPLALPVEHEEPELPSNRIAIIGAGAGGSSAAFWISKAKERWGLDVEIDVFEANDYIGGRSTTVQPYDDPRLGPIELGASIFVEVNKNLWRASHEFGLNLTDSSEEGSDTLGIWDGKEFILTTNSAGWRSWWSTVKVLWRYGINAPRRTQALVKEMLNTFLTLYTTDLGSTPWQDLKYLVSSFDWTSIVNSTATTYLDGQGVNPKFTREMVEAATRVNYGQNADAIHALEAFCSMAANGASQVVGGNWQIFEQFIKRSNASLHLNTSVTSITQKAEDKFVLHTTSSVTNQVSAHTYRAVILAAPFHSASLKVHLLDDAVLPEIPPQPYVHLYVTLLSTPNPSARTRFFGLKEKDTVPAMVLTTWERARSSEDDKPEFNSLSYHGQVKSRDNSPANLTALGLGDPTGRDESGEEWSVKIFSDHPIEDRWLRRAFGRIGWVYRKEWDAYPVLPPTDSFPPIKLAKGFYYVNAFEPFISTMETETISSRNVVELLMQEEYGASICKSAENSTALEEGKDFVYGFDC